MMKAILINLLNPRLTLFFLSFLPQFIIDNRISDIGQMVILSIEKFGYRIEGVRRKAFICMANGGNHGRIYYRITERGVETVK